MTKMIFYSVINSKGKYIPFQLPFIIWILMLILAFQVKGQDRLEKIFLAPPEEAKPRGYWIWAHGNFDYATISSELKAFKEMGLGGVDIFDMGITDPLDIIPPGNPFMGEEMLDGIAFAMEEAGKLGLSMGLSVSNGWNAGGDWTEPDEKIMRLLFWKDTLQGPVNLSQIGFPEIPRKFQKPYGTYDLYPQIRADGFPEYYQNVALVAYPVTADGLVSDFNQIIYFDPGKIDGNQVDISLPAGNWVLMRAVVTPLGQKMWMRSDRSNGFIMDHYSRKATRHHFEYILGKLEERMGNLRESALERLYLASFEAEDYVIWSPELPETFYKNHGYKIEPYIPALAGQKIIDAETTERFLYDYRLTVSEMFVNNHYRQASQICRDHGVLLASESGGPGPPLHYVPTEDLKALGSVDIMRGEFWNKHNRWITDDGLNLMQVVKNIASAAHIYGHRVVEMESFTSQGYHWQESPFELKPLADRAFCEGMTRVVYHTMPHSPPEAGVPGWSYQAGTHIHPKMTWWPLSKPFHQYLARCSALLLEGRFVADVAYYYGHEIPNFAKPKHIRPDLGPGYDYDDLNTEILLQITEVRDGRIKLPTGIEYELLVLPDDPRMDLEVLKKIRELLEKGATVVGPKPTTVYGLSNYARDEKELHDLADQIWGKADRGKKQDRVYGKGRIIYGKTTRKILMEIGITPDFEYRSLPDSAELDYIHRTTGKEEVYFIRNKDSIDVQALIHLRIKGYQPELWDPVSGSMTCMAIYQEDDKGIKIPVQLPPYGSLFIILRDHEKKNVHIRSIRYFNQDLFPGNEPPQINYHASYSDDGNILFTADHGGQYVMTLDPDFQVLVNLHDENNILNLEGTWDVRLPYGWGVTPLQHFDNLMDWTLSSIAGLKYFSGIATYRTTFQCKNFLSGTEQRSLLDLGLVGEVARVYLNGKEAGISLFPPHVLDITHLLKPGENHLVVEVANTWLNRLIGDLGLPLDKQLTRSNVANGSDPSKRPWSNYTLPPSGLMGPVLLKSIHPYRIITNQKESH
jgi:hypothetical protein